VGFRFGVADGVGIFFLFNLHEDPAQWTDGNYANTSSNIRSLTEALIIFFCALVLIGAA